MKYNVAITLPLSLWVTVEADSEEEAVELAMKIAIDEPYENWNDDFSYAQAEIVPD